MTGVNINDTMLIESPAKATSHGTAVALLPEPSALACSGERYQMDAETKTRILVVDDHEQIRDSICRILARKMTVVGAAHNGAEAVEMAKQFLPDLILMDIRMPVMDGIKATRLIHQDQPWIRIIGHSAYEDRELVTEMIDAGAELFVLKGSEDLVSFLASLGG